MSRDVDWFFYKNPYSMQGPLGAQDVKTLLDNPYSLARKEVMGYNFRQAVNVQILHEQTLRINDEIEMQNQRIYSDYQARIEEAENWGFPPELIQQQVAAQNDLNPKLDRSKALSGQLAAEQQKLDDLFKNRDDYIKSVWADQRETQSKALIKDLDVVGIKINAENAKVLASVKKGQEMMIEHPELIPENATVDDVSSKSEVNKNITLMRIMKAQDEGTSLDEVTSLKPSEVMALQKGPLGKVMVKHAIDCSKSDKERMVKEQSTIDMMTQQIDEQAKKVENLQNQVSEVSTEFHHEIALPPFTANLKQLSDACEEQSKQQGKTGQGQQIFEQKLTAMIKDMSPDQLKDFRQSCEESLNSANHSEKSLNAVSTALGITDEVLQQKSSLRQ